MTDLTHLRTLAEKARDTPNGPNRWPDDEQAAFDHFHEAANPDVLLSLLDRLERAEEVLHRRRAHPDYEYEMTSCPRKQGPANTPEGGGWEEFDWERFDYHEEYHWRRLKERVAPSEGAETPTLTPPEGL